MVLLRAEGPQVPKRFQNEPGYPCRVLEIDGERPEGVEPEPGGGDEEDTGVLQREGTTRDKDRLGNA